MQEYYCVKIELLLVSSCSNITHYDCSACKAYCIYRVVFSKRRKGEKSGGKGLRHFSMKVCEKVEKKGITTYNEVADELVSELSDLQSGLSDFVSVMLPCSLIIIIIIIIYFATE